METAILPGQSGEPRLTQEDVSRLSREAVQPGTTPDFVNLNGREIPIKFMPIAREREVIRLLTPLLPRLRELEDLSKLPAVADDAFMLMPKVVAIIAGELATVEWIEANCSTMDLWAVIQAQLTKYGLQDRLGKLWRSFAPKLPTTETDTSLLPS